MSQKGERALTYSVTVPVLSEWLLQSSQDSSVWSWEPGLVRPGVDRVLEKLQWGQKMKQ